MTGLAESPHSQPVAVAWTVAVSIGCIFVALIASQGSGLPVAPLVTDFVGIVFVSVLLAATVLTVDVTVSARRTAQLRAFWLSTAVATLLSGVTGMFVASSLSGAEIDAMAVPVLVGLAAITILVLSIVAYLAVRLLTHVK